jgi:hypothetical protein
LDAQQAKQGDGRPGVALVTAALAPDRTLDRRADAGVARDELNQTLSLSGYCVRDDGRAGRTSRATTDESVDHHCGDDVVVTTWW